MKRYLLILFFSIALTSCSINTNDTSQPQVITVYWNLVNVSGGVSGVDIDYNVGDIVWLFDEVNTKLTVTNTNTDDTLEDGLDSGTYPYSVINNSHDLFLSIDGTEFGSFTVSGNQLIIDQNITTGGTGADGYVYTFQKTTVIE
ncbi:hypothetical protein GCM10007962_17920 [Yeosuana aromativorans]|uniref:Lipocalin-like domain-containing protein n=1 Tax=Yeosuana aromativorans TaxID=288019 RepID=A0A8J3BNN2_9FLAO|nr:hypothetical protein [Yeosuana aromativorans]GGK24134.1 hypothetical protein GCM10007962_17920 [Yeosuana aromativorans]